MPVKSGKPAKKYSQAARLHDVIRLLEARYGMTVNELVQECGVTRRTIYRDLDAIRQAGYPLHTEATADGQVLYRFLTGFKRIPPITFSIEELMTLYFCRGQLDFLQGTPFQQDLDAVFSRIRSSLPPRSVAHLERIASAAAPRFRGLRNYADQAEVLSVLRQALLRQRRCRLHYAPPRREPEVYQVDPYTLLFYQDSLYLGGYAHNRQALRLFLVDRIRQAEVTGERFTIADDFTPEQLTGQAFGLIDDRPMAVRLRFAADIAYLIRERTWHPGQTLSDNPDGSVELAFTAAGQREILSWVYSFLPHVQVLAPAELRQAFRQGLEQGLAAVR